MKAYIARKWKLAKFTIFIITIILNISSAQAVDEKEHQQIKRSAKPFFPVHLILQAILQNQPQTLQVVKQLHRISSPSLAIKEILKPITDITSATSIATNQLLQKQVIKPINALLHTTTRVKRGTEPYQRAIDRGTEKHIMDLQRQVQNLTKLLQGRQAEEEENWRKSRKRRQALPMWQRIIEDVIGMFMGNF